MKLNYFPDTDSLYIELADQPSADSREVSEGVVIDYDARGNLVAKSTTPARKSTCGYCSSSI